MSPWSIKVVNTPEGVVIRRFWASGEDAYRVTPVGQWHHCLDHKGPWVVVGRDQVPDHVIDALRRERP